MRLTISAMRALVVAFGTATNIARGSAPADFSFRFLGGVTDG